jgi:hypothetical protein
MNRMAPSTALLLTGLIGLIGLGACGTGANPAPAPAASSTTASAASATPSTPATPATPGTPATSATSAAPPAPATTTTSAGAYRAADVCTYLTGQLPALKAIGAPAGVQANLAGNLFGFFQSHGVPADGAHLDDATEAQCPDVRSQILVLSGLTSFTQL